jgi:ubiquinone/menaquinone biosynthesis C-methylase UbiE
VSIGRRKVALEDPAAWVFNRMVEPYEARPEYPEALIDAVAALATVEARVLDVGAGLGHLALPLAQRGLAVTALEPAVHMLQRLEHKAALAQVSLTPLHGQAEALPFSENSIDVVVLADALHFMDSERAAREIARVLSSRGALAVLICEFAPTPFMTALQSLMQESAPRRPRDTRQSLTELFATAGMRCPTPTTWTQELDVDETTLFRILGSISFIGPAMNAARTATFNERVRAIPHPRRWARKLCLYAAKRGRSVD